MNDKKGLVVEMSYDKIDEFEELLSAVRYVSELGETSNYWKARPSELRLRLQVGGFYGHKDGFVESVMESLEYKENGGRS